MIELENHTGRTLLSEDMILHKVRELGQQISSDYIGKEPVIICVLKGAVVFLADLMRNIDIQTNLDFVQLSSYGDRMESSGQVTFLQDITTDIKDRDVLIVDDIMDSGLTLYRLKENLLSRNPASLKICVLLDKLERRSEDIKADYSGFKIPDEFIVGYGMDYKGLYRGLRYIASLNIQTETNFNL